MNNQSRTQRRRKEKPAVGLGTCDADAGDLTVDGRTLHASTSLLPSYRCRISAPPAAKTVCRMDSWCATSKIAPTTSASRALAWRRCKPYNAALSRRLNLGACARISSPSIGGVFFCKIYSV